MITIHLIQECRMAVVVSGAVLVGIVFSILALHISAAVDTVKNRRRLQRELHLLTILFTGSITISLSACVQVCRFLTFAVIEPTSELNTLWYIADSVCESVYFCHCVAMVVYMCYFMYTYVKGTPEVKNSFASISLEDGNSSSSCSDHKLPHTCRQFQPPASLQTVHPAEDTPVTVENYKQTCSHFDATLHFLITIAYFFSILVTVGFVLYLFSTMKEYHTASPIIFNSSHLWIEKIVILLLCGISFIAINFLGFNFSLACKSHMSLNCFLIFLNFCIPFMCEYQCHGLLNMWSLLGVFTAALTSYFLAIEHIKQSDMD